MACTNYLNISVYVNRCFCGIWKSGELPKTKTKKIEKEMKRLRTKRDRIKSKIEEAKPGSLESEEAKRDLESLEVEVAAIFKDFTSIDGFYKNIKIGAWGGSGRNEFNMDRSVSRIIKVTLHFEVVVGSLEVSYVEDGNNFTTRRLGSEYGASNHTFELSPGEYINSMFGSVCEYEGETCVSKLEFNTNFGKHYGPFGRAGGSNFIVPFKDGHIVGFFGQFTKYLNQIGVYLTPN